MYDDENLKNCRIIIRNLWEEKTIADTKIIAYNWERNTVRINALSMESLEQSEICVLIFGKKGIYEFCGKVSSANVANEIEIALYRGKEKEARVCKRYSFQVKGEAENVTILNNSITLNKPIEITTVNMSASGILLRALQGSFEECDTFEIILVLEEKRLILECKIARIHNIGLRIAEYGCEILSGHEGLNRDELLR